MLRGLETGLVSDSVSISAPKLIYHVVSVLYNAPLLAECVSTEESGRPSIDGAEIAIVLPLAFNSFSLLLVKFADQSISRFVNKMNKQRSDD